MSIIYAVMVALLLAACVRDEAPAIAITPDAAVAVAAPTQVASAVAQPTSSDDRCAGERAEAIELRLLVADLQAKVIAAQDETARHRAGLDRAVAELNRLQSAAASYAVPSLPRPSYTPPAATARVAQYSPPLVNVIGDGIEVSGRLYNSGDATFHGTILVELLQDGKPYDSATQQMTIPPNNAMAYSQIFRRMPSGGTYSARVTPSP